MSRFWADLLLLAVLAAAAALLASCASQVVVPREVRVPVPVACISAAGRPQKPALRTAADLMGMDRYRRTLAAWSDLRAYEAYTAELEALIEGCSRIVPAR